MVSIWQPPEFEDYEELVLEEAGTTSFDIRHPDDPDVERREGYEPQFQATVRNDSDTTHTAMVVWRFDGEDVLSSMKALGPGETDTLANRLHYRDVADKFVGDTHEFSAVLLSGSNWAEQQDVHGSIHVHGRPLTGGREDGGDVDGDPNTGDNPNETPDNDSGGNDSPNNDTGDQEPSGPAPLLPENFPTLPAVGPLTGPMVTLIALAGVAVVILR